MVCPIYRMKSIQYIELYKENHCEDQIFEQYGLIYCCEGYGELILNNKIYVFKSGSLFLASPSSIVSVRNEQSDSLRFFKVQFEELGATSKQFGILATGYLEPPTGLKLETYLKSMEQHSKTANPILQYEYHLQFEQLLLAVAKQNYAPSQANKSVRKLTEETLAYIHEHFKENLRVDQLARFCNISTRHYTRLFVELTGKAPVEYWTALRISHSVHELVASGGKLKNVAQEAGYANYDYYSKKFKEKMGMTPSGYILNWRKSPRIIALQCAGDLFALQIKPVAVMANGLEAPFQKYINSVAVLDREYRYADGKLAAEIAALRPDLIVAGDYMAVETLDVLSRISPVVTVEWTGISPLHHLDVLSGILGKEKEKLQWLERYNNKKTKLIQQLKEITVSEKQQTAAVFYMWQDKIRVFAPHIFPTFYDILGYRMPLWYQQWKLNDRQLGSMSVTLESFPAFLADRMFIIIQDKQALGTFGKLESITNNDGEESERKQFVLLKPDWHSIDAISLEWQLETAYNLFAGTLNSIRYN